MTTKVDYKEVKMIRIDDDTHDRLKRHGRFGDSFQDIINRLMDIAEGKRKKNDV